MNRAPTAQLNGAAGRSRLEGSVPGKTQTLAPFSVPSGLIGSLVLHPNVSVVSHVDSTPRSVPLRPWAPKGQC